MPKSTSYATSENEVKIMAMDDSKLARWPVPYESLTVPTRCGDTHIIASGRQDALPLVLIHALGVTSTMWLPNVAALSRDYRTYALDTIGDLGKSTLYEHDLYPKNGQAYSEWLVDVFNEIGIGQAHVIGACSQRCYRCAPAKVHLRPASLAREGVFDTRNAADAPAVGGTGELNCATS